MRRYQLHGRGSTVCQVLPAHLSNTGADLLVGRLMLDRRQSDAAQAFTVRGAVPSYDEAMHSIATPRVGV